MIKATEIVNSNRVTIVFPRQNNLEWLRLLFALQVVVMHASEHLNSPFAIVGLLKHFPGVPAFFFVSGFLIYASYLNAPGWRYFHNRFLRLFPGLVFVTAGGASVALVAHGAGELIARFPVYATWVIAQTTLGQAYNPALFRDVGVGVINGSLWTLTTEILFYFAVPLIVLLERRVRHAVLISTALSFAVYVFGPHLLTRPILRDKTLYDVLSLTPVVWGWMFGFGMLAVKHFDRINRHIRLLPLAVVPATLLIWLGTPGPIVGAAGNQVGILYFAMYACLVLWLAFGTPYVRLGADLSYGTYVWHMPAINLLLVMATPSFPIALTLTVALACISWFGVERPALARKKRSIQQSITVDPSASGANALNRSATDGGA